MARPLRLEFHGALYHVTSRGDGQEDIYLGDDDRATSLAVLEEVVERFNWTVHAYCLMSNHYHLLVETPDGNLAQGMRQFNGIYTQRFNRRHQRVGHVFQGRYKAIIVQKDSYLLELARYIVLNPVRAGMVRSAKDWPWSSYRATAGFSSPPPWLHTDWILSAFGTHKGPALERYRIFVAEGKNRPSPWQHLRNQIYLGDEQFVDKLQTGLEKGKDLSEIPAAQRRRPARSLDYYAQKHRDRDDAIVTAYRSGGYSLKAIGDHFGLHYSRVSRIVASAEKARPDPFARVCSPVKRQKARPDPFVCPQQVAEGAHRAGRPVSVCGEMAADPAAIILLLGMGIDSLSVNVASIARVKWVIRSFSRQRARELLRQCLAMEEPSAIRGVLNNALVQAGLGGLVRAGKH